MEAPPRSIDRDVYRLIVEKAIEYAIILADIDGTIRTWNSGAQETFGYTAREIIGKSAALLFTPEDREKGIPEMEMQKALTTGRAEDQRWHVRKDGSRFWASGRAMPIHDEAGKLVGILKIARDATAGKHAEEELRESELRFRELAENILEAFWTADPDFNSFQYVSSSFETIWGRSVDTLYHDPESFLEAVAEVDRERVRAMMKDLKTRKASAEYRIVRPDGTIRWIWVRGFPVRDENGQVSRVVGIAEDINDRKRIEELERSNRELQAFAYVASHDLKEPLRKVQTFASLLSDEYGEVLDVTGREYVERVQSTADRMGSLIEDLLAYSQVTSDVRPLVPVDLGRIARDVLSDLEAQIATTEGIVHVDGLPTIEADPIHMRQLFQNLIGNALKFRRDEVPPEVRVHGEIEPETGTLLLMVTDNGIGFDEKYVDQLFTPFRRLHQREQYPGTGIGLAICRRIAERHGGSITARSTPGEGSTVIVKLPVSQKANGEKNSPNGN